MQHGFELTKTKTKTKLGIRNRRTKRVQSQACLNFAEQGGEKESTSFLNVECGIKKSNSSFHIPHSTLRKFHIPHSTFLIKKASHSLSKLRFLFSVFFIFSSLTILVKGNLYADPTSYTVTVKTLNATICTVSGGGSVKENKTTTITATILNQDGYKFAGWQKNNDTNYVSTSATYTTPKITSDVVYTACYEEKTFAFALNANGGTVSPGSITLSYTSNFSSLPTPDWPGHTFEGWYTSINYTTQITSTSQVKDYINLSPRTLYAKWSCNVSVSSVTASTEATNNTICKDKSTKLKATATFTPSTASCTYAWAQNGTAVSNPQSISPTGQTTYTVTATASLNGCTATKTNSVTVYVNSPAISLTDTKAEPNWVCAGQSTTLSTEPSGTYQSVTYKWTGPSSYSTESSGDVTVSNMSSAKAGTYTVTATASNTLNSVTCTKTATGTVNVIVKTPKISITGITQSSPTCLGGPLTLSVTEGEKAGDTYTYVWTKNGNTLSTSSSSSYSVNAVDNANAGTYTVAATAKYSDACSATDSKSITVTVSHTPDMNEISQPDEISAGNSFDLPDSSEIITYDGPGCRVIGWKYYDNEEGTYKAFSNEEVPLSMNGKSLRYFVTNDCGEDSSNAVTMKVCAAPKLSTSIITPTHGYCEGQALDIVAPTVNAQGGSYETVWQKSISQSGPFANFNAQSVPYDNNGSYWVRYYTYNSCDKDSTIAVQISVQQAPSLSLTNANQTKCNGTEIETITIGGNGTVGEDDVVGLTKGLTWNSTAQTITGTANSTCAYTVTSSSSNGCTTTASGTITVNRKPTIVVHNFNSTICEGGSFDLQLDTRDDNGSEIDISTEGWQITTSLSSAYTKFTNSTVMYTSNGNYIRYFAKNECGVTTTDPIQVFVNKAPAAPTAIGDTVCGTDKGTLTAVPGEGNNCRWYDNGGQQLADGSPYTTETLAAGSEYQYKVSSFNTGTGCESLSKTTVTVIASGLPTISTVNPTNMSCHDQQDGKLTVSASQGTLASSLLYTKDNGDNWQTGNTFSNLSAGSYTIKVKNNLGCEASSSAVSIVNPDQLTVSMDYSAVQMCAGGSVDLQATAQKAQGNVTYNWFANGSSIGSSNPITIYPTTTTNYSVSVSDDKGCTATGTSTKTVTVLGAFSPGAINSGGQSINSGGDVSEITSLSAATGGSSTPTYRWLHNGQEITGATSATYTPIAYKSQAGSHVFTRQAQSASCNSGWVSSAGSYTLIVNDPSSLSYTISLNENVVVTKIECWGAGGGGSSYQYGGGGGGGYAGITPKDSAKYFPTSVIPATATLSVVSGTAGTTNGNGGDSYVQINGGNVLVKAYGGNCASGAGGGAGGQGGESAVASNVSLNKKNGGNGGDRGSQTAWIVTTYYGGGGGGAAGNGTGDAANGGNGAVGSSSGASGGDKGNGDSNNKANTGGGAATAGNQYGGGGGGRDDNMGEAQVGARGIAVVYLANKPQASITTPDKICENGKLIISKNITWGGPMGSDPVSGTEEWQLSTSSSGTFSYQTSFNIDRVTKNWNGYYLRLHVSTDYGDGYSTPVLIQVQDTVTPAFANLTGKYCSSGGELTLPQNADNNDGIHSVLIPGSWKEGTASKTSITLNNNGQDNIEHTLTFTPNSGYCARKSQEKVTVLGVPSVSITSTVASICVNTKYDPSFSKTDPTDNTDPRLSYTQQGWYYSQSESGQYTKKSLPSPLDYVSSGYYFTYLVKNSCNTYTSDTVHVSVNNVPVFDGRIGSVAPICNGSTLSLTAPHFNPYAETGHYTEQWELSQYATSADSWSELKPEDPIYANKNLWYLRYHVNNDCGDAYSDTVRIEVHSIPAVTVTPSDTSICEGKSAKLTAITEFTVLWSYEAQTTKSITISPAATTTYQVQVTDGIGCTNTATATVTVKDTTWLTVSGDTTKTLCAGESFEISLSSNATITPTNLPSGISFDASTGKLSGIPTETKRYTITADLENDCGAKSFSGLITVNPRPAVPTLTGLTRQPDTVIGCGVSAVTLNANPGNLGTTCRWYNQETGGTKLGNDATSYNTGTLSNGIYNYYVSSIAATGCESTARTKVVAVICPNPTISDVTHTDMTCHNKKDGTITVTANAYNPATSLLYTRSNWTSGQTENKFKQLLAGTYTIKVNDNFGCEKVLDSTVTIKNPDSLTVSLSASSYSICESESVTLTATAEHNQGAVTYTWKNGSTQLGDPTSTNTKTDTPTASSNSYNVYIKDSHSCTATATASTVTMYPKVSMNTPANQYLCHNDKTTTITFEPASALASGESVQYKWTRSENSNITWNPELGTSSSEYVTSIGEYTVSNNSNTAQVVTVTVTPYYTNANITNCEGNPVTYTYTVYPHVVMEDLSSNTQTLCHGSSLSTISLSSSITDANAVTYSWTRTNTDNVTGIANSCTSGCTSISASSVSNTTNTAQATVFTVSPKYTSQDGQSKNCPVIADADKRQFTITVNPETKLTAKHNKNVVSHDSLLTLKFSTSITDGERTFHWSRDNSNVTGWAMSGNEDTLALYPENETATAQVVHVKAWLSYTNGGKTCTTPVDTVKFNITVNPRIRMQKPSDQYICHSSKTTANTFTCSNLTLGSGASVKYKWTRSGNTNISWNPTLDASSDNSTGIGQYTVSNTTSTAQMETVTVTPYYTNNGITDCKGEPVTYTYTVYPHVVMDDLSANTQKLCHGSAFSTANNFSTTITDANAVTYTWTRTNTGATGVTGVDDGCTSGCTSISSTGLSNVTNSAQATTFTVMPTYTSIDGQSTVCPALDADKRQFTLTVYPQVVVNNPGQQYVSNDSTLTVNLTSSISDGTISYTWERSAVSGITGTENGSGESLSTPIEMTLKNTNTTATTTVVTVTPTYKNTTTNETCTGTPFSFNVTVHPRIQIDPITDRVMGHDSIIKVAFTHSEISGGTLKYRWRRTTETNVGGMGTASTSDTDIDTPLEIHLTNTNTSSKNITFTITPVFSNNGIDNIVGESKTFVVTVNPHITMSASPKGAITCTGTSYGTISFSTPLDVTSSGTSIKYKWTRTNATNVTGMDASGESTSLSAILSTTQTSQQTTHFTVTPWYTANGLECAGDTIQFNITLKVKPEVTITQPAAICEGNAISSTASFNNHGGTINGKWQKAHSTGAFEDNYNMATTLTYYDNNGDRLRYVAWNECGNDTSDVKTITVHQKPAVPSIAITPSSAELCYGGNVTLKATSTLTTTEPGGFHFEWTKDGSAVSGNTSDTYVYTTPAVGNHTMKVKQVSNNGCGSSADQTQTFTVHPNPEFTFSGNTSICSSGGSTTLTLNQTAHQSLQGAITYDWSLNNTIIGHGSSLTVYPTSSSTYQVKATNAHTCTATNSQTVTVSSTIFNPGAITGGIASVAQNATTSITIGNSTSASGGSGAISYKWKVSSNGGTLTDASGTNTNETYSVDQTYKNTVGSHVFTRWAKAANCCNDWVQSSGSYTVMVTTTATEGYTITLDAYTVVTKIEAWGGGGGGSTSTGGGGGGGGGYARLEPKSGEAYITSIESPSTLYVYNGPGGKIGENGQPSYVKLNNSTGDTCLKAYAGQKGYRSTGGQGGQGGTTLLSGYTPIKKNGGDGGNGYNDWGNYGGGGGGAAGSGGDGNPGKSSDGSGAGGQGGTGNYGGGTGNGGHGGTPNTYTEAVTEGNIYGGGGGGKGGSNRSGKAGAQGIAVVYLATAPSATISQPSAICEGGSLSIPNTISWGDGTSQSSQWQFAANNGFSSIAATTTDISSYSVSSSFNNYYVRLAVTTEYGTRYSNAVQITVKSKVTPTMPEFATNYCADGTVLSLPTTATNTDGMHDGYITGTWNQITLTNNTSDDITTTATFTPNSPFCASTKNYSIKIYGLPKIADITSPDPICVNNHLSKTAPAVSSTPGITGQGWQLSNSTDPSGSYSDFDISTNLGFEKNGFYLRYKASDTCNRTNYSNAVQISVNNTPVITGTLTAPSAVCNDSNLVITVPAVTEYGLCSREWQISANGTSGWETLDTTSVGYGKNNHYVRYHAWNLCGDVYSNAVQITVNPRVYMQTPASISICHNDNVNIPFSHAGEVLTESKMSYTWTSSNSNVGGLTPGTVTSTGIVSEHLTNNTTEPQTTTITVTPSYTDNSITCVGEPISFTITVNPKVIMNTISNKTLCNGGSLNVEFGTTLSTSGTTTYHWTRNNSAEISGSESGDGNISNETYSHVNASDLGFKTATFTVIPTFKYNDVSCTALSDDEQTFDVVVNPTVVMDTPSGQHICHGTAFTTVTFSSDNTGGTMSYSWTRTNTDKVTGLAESADNVTSLPATTLSNTNLTLQVTSFTVTPTYTLNSVSCPGSTVTFKDTVNPQVKMKHISNQYLCHNTSSDAVTLTTPITDGSMSYSWSRDKRTEITGLPEEGSTATIAAGTALNTTTTAQTTTYTVHPTYTNGISCSMTGDSTFKIVVNPSVSLAQVDAQYVSHDSTKKIQLQSGNSTDGSISYTWTRTGVANVSGSETGSGNSLSDLMSIKMTNTNNEPKTVTFTVTPTYHNNGKDCEGTTMSFDMTVNPKVTMMITSPTPADQTICSADQFDAHTFGTDLTIDANKTIVYNWTRTSVEGVTTTLATTGTGDIAATAMSNSNTEPKTVSFTVTPRYTANGITVNGETKSFTITVNPEVKMNTVSDQSLCDGSTLEVTFGTQLSGGSMKYSWDRTNNNIGTLPMNGETTTGISSAVTTTQTTQQTDVITIRPIFTNVKTCPATDANRQSFKLTLYKKPVTPTITSTADVVCHPTGVTFTATSENPDAGSFLWVGKEAEDAYFNDFSQYSVGYNFNPSDVYYEIDPTTQLYVGTVCTTVVAKVNDSHLLETYSCGHDAQFTMYDALGEGTNIANKYFQIRYRVKSDANPGTTNGMQFYFSANGTGSDIGEGHAIYVDFDMSGNNWHTLTFAAPTYTDWTNIKGWRFDFATRPGVRMEFAYIALVEPTSNTSLVLNAPDSGKHQVYVSQISNYGCGGASEAASKTVEVKTLNPGAITNGSMESYLCGSFTISNVTAAKCTSEDDIDYKWTCNGTDIPNTNMSSISEAQYPLHTAGTFEFKRWARTTCTACTESTWGEATGSYSITVKHTNPGSIARSASNIYPCQDFSITNSASAECLAGQTPVYQWSYTKNGGTATLIDVPNTTTAITQANLPLNEPGVYVITRSAKTTCTEEEWQPTSVTITVDTVHVNPGSISTVQTTQKRVCAYNDYSISSITAAQSLVAGQDLHYKWVCLRILDGDTVEYKSELFNAWSEASLVVEAANNPEYLIEETGLYIIQRYAWAGCDQSGMEAASNQYRVQVIAPNQAIENALESNYYEICSGGKVFLTSNNDLATVTVPDYDNPKTNISLERFSTIFIYSYDDGSYDEYINGVTELTVDWGSQAYLKAKYDYPQVTGCYAYSEAEIVQIKWDPYFSTSTIVSPSTPICPNQVVTITAPELVSYITPGTDQPYYYTWLTSDGSWTYDTVSSEAYYSYEENGKIVHITNSLRVGQLSYGVITENALGCNIVYPAYATIQIENAEPIVLTSTESRKYCPSNTGEEVSFATTIAQSYGTIKWYSDSLSQTALTEVPKASLAAERIFVYYVSQDNSNCESARIPDTIEVRYTSHIAHNTGSLTQANLKQKSSYTAEAIEPIVFEYSNYYANGTAVPVATGLPRGLSAVASNGVFTISGIPTEAGTFNYTVSLAGGECPQPTVFNGTLTVYPTYDTTVYFSSCSGETYTVRDSHNHSYAVTTLGTHYYGCGTVNPLKTVHGVDSTVTVVFTEDVWNQFGFEENNTLIAGWSSFSSVASPIAADCSGSVSGSQITFSDWNCSFSQGTSLSNTSAACNMGDSSIAIPYSDADGNATNGHSIIIKTSTAGYGKLSFHVDCRTDKADERYSRGVSLNQITLEYSTNGATWESFAQTQYLPVENNSTKQSAIDLDNLPSEMNHQSNLYIRMTFDGAAIPAYILSDRDLLIDNICISGKKGINNVSLNKSKDTVCRNEYITLYAPEPYVDCSVNPCDTVDITYNWTKTVDGSTETLQEHGNILLDQVTASTTYKVSVGSGSCASTAQCVVKMEEPIERMDIVRHQTECANNLSSFVFVDEVTGQPVIGAQILSPAVEDMQTPGEYDCRLSIPIDPEIACDSIIKLKLTVLKSYDTTIVASICLGESYTDFGFNITPTETGVTYYRHEGTCTTDCDSIVNLTLETRSVEKTLTSVEDELLAAWPFDEGHQRIVPSCGVRSSSAILTLGSSNGYSASTVGGKTVASSLCYYDETSKAIQLANGFCATLGASWQSYDGTYFEMMVLPKEYNNLLLTFDYKKSIDDAHSSYTDINNTFNTMTCYYKFGKNTSYPTTGSSISLSGEGSWTSAQFDLSSAQTMDKDTMFLKFVLSGGNKGQGRSARVGIHTRYQYYPAYFTIDNVVLTGDKPTQYFLSKSAIEGETEFCEGGTATFVAQTDPAMYVSTADTFYFKYFDFYLTNDVNSSYREQFTSNKMTITPPYPANYSVVAYDRTVGCDSIVGTYRIQLNETAHIAEDVTKFPDHIIDAPTTCSGVHFAFVPTDSVHGKVPPTTKYSWETPGNSTIEGIRVVDSVSVHEKEDSIRCLIYNENADRQPVTVNFTVTPWVGDCPCNPFKVRLKVFPAVTLGLYEYDRVESACPGEQDLLYVVDLYDVSADTYKIQWEFYTDTTVNVFEEVAWYDEYYISLPDICDTSYNVKVTYADYASCAISKSVTISAVDNKAPTLEETWPDDITGQNNCFANADRSVLISDEDVVALFSDNCYGAITATSEDSDNPTSDCGWTITRTYTIKDACGNIYYTDGTSTLPTQKLSGSDQTKPTFTRPKDTVLYVTNIPVKSTDTTTSALGVPTSVEDNCSATANITVTHRDSIVSVCGHAEKVYRIWRVVDACGNVSVSDSIQFINVLDTVTLTVTGDTSQIKCYHASIADIVFGGQWTSLTISPSTLPTNLQFTSSYVDATGAGTGKLSGARTNAGTLKYTVTATNPCDASSATSSPMTHKSMTGTITHLDTLIMTVIVDSSECGDNNGTIMASATGGSKPYKFKVDDDPTAGKYPGVFNNVSEGSHTVTLADSLNCPYNSLDGKVNIKQLNVADIKGVTRYGEVTDFDRDRNMVTRTGELDTLPGITQYGEVIEHDRAMANLTASATGNTIKVSVDITKVADAHTLEFQCSTDSTFATNVYTKKLTDLSVTTFSHDFPHLTAGTYYVRAILRTCHSETIQVMTGSVVVSD